jgi:hypothetical protein
MRLSEQLLESQVAKEKPEQAKRVSGRIFTIRSDFTEASINFSIDFLHKKAARSCENH